MAELERLIAAGLAHPAIAAPLAAGIADAQAYLAAEFAAADSLDIVIRDNGPAPVGHAIKVAAQLAGAIDYAAAVGIAHGALHPRDVLVSADDTRLTGFGIAQALERVGFAVPVRRPYSAPERIENAKWGREADVFALAAVSYELLTGRRVAGPGVDAADGLSSVPGVDLEMARAVFARALAADPALRFETALQFADALKQSIDEAVAAESAAPRETRRPRRHADEEAPRLPLDEPQPASAAPVADLATADVAIVPRVSTFDPADIDLAAAETERYRNVESAPSVAPEPEAVVRDLPLASAPLSPDTRRRTEDVRRTDDLQRPPEPARGVLFTEPVVPAVIDRPPVSALERSRSAMWPLVLALVVGVAMGFAAGYGVGTRVTTPSAAPREFTETTVPAADPVAAAAAQALANSPRPAQSGPPPAAATPPQATASQNTAPAAAAAPSAKAAPPAEAPAAPARSAPLEDERAAEAGRLLVRSTPEGASVYVDGRERGRTPIAIRDLARGSHRVRIAREGYVAAERRVVITARRPSQSLQVALGIVAAREAPTRPAAAETFVGVLIVESRPTGAKVYLDGRPIGTTPVQVPGVSAGSHVVRLEHDGYRRWSSAVRVVAGEQNRVTASLEK